MHSGLHQGSSSAVTRALCVCAGWRLCGFLGRAEPTESQVCSAEEEDGIPENVGRAASGLRLGKSGSLQLLPQELPQNLPVASQLKRVHQIQGIPASRTGQYCKM